MEANFISQLSIFVLAIFVGYYVVWSVTPALHTPLMAYAAPGAHSRPRSNPQRLPAQKSTAGR